jgi:hypothetical protein
MQARLGRNLLHKKKKKKKKKKKNQMREKWSGKMIPMQ